MGLPLSRDGPAFCGRRSLDSFQRCSRSLAQLPRLAGGCFLAALCAQALVLPRAEGSFVLVLYVLVSATACLKMSVSLARVKPVALA